MSNQPLIDIYQDINSLRADLEKIILGKEEFIKFLLVGFFSGGHILIEDVPGLGKTTAAKALARLIKDASSSRIQCTPDLLPYDITGVEFYDTQKGTFSFEKGPIFADIVLADELNRATPRTQSALLEAMAESQVTISNKTYPLSSIFFVIATQNPIDAEASYHLPIAELDRFLFKLSIGYPSIENEKTLLQYENKNNYLENVTPTIDLMTIKKIQHSLQKVYCDDKILTLVTHIAHAARRDPQIMLGPSPRASIQLIQAVKALALIENRHFVIDEDVKRILPIAWIHRMKAKDDAIEMQDILMDIYNNEWPRIFLRS